ncbi:IS110 family transposase [Streptomyces guryensis]|uniref:IS110 family transposase n=1 Tax=Streptomyces guryensis TaxID=2886947 RepID=A0A9Q3W0A8_9ACTN|nr:IS110 family transposase [Streptomyces guryensis]MCD9880820.1 IS110 family transposase [Streptomyces guryensis]
MLALLVQLEAACTAADNLSEAEEDTFPQHPDAEIVLSFPRLGIQLASRVLAEVGDDRNCFADACGLRAYASASPITRPTGQKASITRRGPRGARRRARDRPGKPLQPHARPAPALPLPATGTAP